MDWKNIAKMSTLIQSHLQIQCNHYSNGIFKIMFFIWSISDYNVVLVFTVPNDFFLNKSRNNPKFYIEW